MKSSRLIVARPLREGLGGGGGKAGALRKEKRRREAKEPIKLNTPKPSQLHWASLYEDFDIQYRYFIFSVLQYNLSIEV